MVAHSYNTNIFMEETLQVVVQGQFDLYSTIQSILAKKKKKKENKTGKKSGEVC